MLSERERIFFCFCGPTASGKSTISRELVKRESGLRLSCSTTTRPSRAGEVDGVDYYFVSEEEFENRVQAGAFIEHASFSGHRYGTEVRNLQEAEKQECDVVLDIEVQGVFNLKKLFPKQVVTIFVFPPSMIELRARLVARGAETKEQIQLRLQTAKQELPTLKRPDFSDFFLLNDNLERAVTQAHKIICAERCRLARYRADFLATMLGTEEQ